MIRVTVRSGGMIQARCTIVMASSRQSRFYRVPFTMLTGLAFLGAFFTACVLSIARHPIYGLMAYVGVFYVHPPTRWWVYAIPDMRWSVIAALATVIGLVARSRKEPIFPILPGPAAVFLLILLTWILIQGTWALNPAMHSDLTGYAFKFAIAFILIYKSIDSEDNLRLFLWANVLGCFTFGWYAFNNYTGGRFEDYGGPGFADANYAAIASVSGLFAAGGLLLTARTNLERFAVIVAAAFIANALVTTVSRSGFLALTVGGLSFIWFCPKKFRARVVALAIIGLLGFISITTNQYWERINSITYVGEEVEGTDTGAGRLEIMSAQIEMFSQYPLGCGHRCTATLSPYFLDEHHLKEVNAGQRSSHNTFLTLLVEQGFVGAALYIIFLVWLLRIGLKIKKEFRDQSGALQGLVPGIVAILAAIVVAENFVDYLKLEQRVWYAAVLLVVVKLMKKEESLVVEASPLPDSPGQEHRGRSSTFKTNR